MSLNTVSAFRFSHSQNTRPHVCLNYCISHIIELSVPSLLFPHVLPTYSNMPNGTLFTSQTTPSLSSAATSARPASQSAAITAPNGASSTSVADESTDATSAAATELSTAIDEFLGDLDKKFKGIGDEILGKCKSCLSSSRFIRDRVKRPPLTSAVDDMAARCDRIEAELLMHEQTEVSPSKGSETASG